MANYEVSYFPSYLSIDDILASQDRVQCRFEVPVKGLGYLDASSGSDDIEVGARLELPCWLARALHACRGHTISPRLPQPYRQPSREVLQADATVVDLHRLGPYFYDTGLHVLPLAPAPDRPRLALCLAQALRARLRPLMDAAQHCGADDGSARLATLDRLEARLFAGGQSSVRAYERWAAREAHLLHTAPLLAQRKRKRADS